MVCPLCKLDPTGECNFCRMEREFKNIKKLEKPNSSYLFTNYNLSNQDYSNLNRCYHNNYSGLDGDKSYQLHGEYFNIISGNSNDYKTSRYNSGGKYEKAA